MLKVKNETVGKNAIVALSWALEKAPTSMLRHPRWPNLYSKPTARRENRKKNPARTNVTL